MDNISLPSVPRGCTLTGETGTCLDIHVITDAERSEPDYVTGTTRLIIVDSEPAWCGFPWMWKHAHTGLVDLGAACQYDNLPF